MHDHTDTPSGISRRTVLRRFLVGGAALAVPGVLTACGQRENAAATAGTKIATARGGTITWGKAAEATLLDPTAGAVGSSMELFQVVYDALLGTDGELQLVPSLAERWEEKSPTTYEFTLRQGVKFSNGRALTADDVVASFEHYLDPKAGSSLASFVSTEAKVTKVDARTVRFMLPAPSSTFLSAIASAYAVILPMKEVAAGRIDLTKEMLGTGPFMVQRHKAGSAWTMVRNPHAWQPPVADRLDVRIMPDDNARIAALRDGSIDITTFDVPDAQKLLAGVPNTAVKVQERTDFYVLILNATDPRSPFVDERVRRAVAHAIDRDRIREIALAGTGRPTAAVSATFGDAPAPTLDHDVARAKALLAEAGATDLSFEIVYPGEAFGRIAQVLQQNLQDVGVRVKLGDLEEGVWLDRVYTQDPPKFDATVSWYAAYVGPGQALNLWNTKVSPFGFQLDDPGLTKLIVAAQSAEDDAQEREALRKASAAIDAQANTITLTTKPATIAWREDQVAVEVDGRDGNIDPLRHVNEYALARA
ncbi:ABC transporter substrate-binding protein [Patulibacter sp. S7RM1-6]